VSAWHKARAHAVQALKLIALYNAVVYKRRHNNKAAPSVPLGRGKHGANLADRHRDQPSVEQPEIFLHAGILATITAFSFSIIFNFVRHEAEVGRSFETLAKTDLVLTLMLNAETDTCGYLITLRERFLQPFFTKNILPRTLRSLGAAISARLKQHRRFHQLASLTAQALASIDSRITLKRGTAPHERI
jgi:hypothetical protein